MSVPLLALLVAAQWHAAAAAGRPAGEARPRLRAAAACVWALETCFLAGAALLRGRGAREGQRGGRLRAAARRSPRPS